MSKKILLRTRLWLNHKAWSIVHKFRRRIPLYADDRSRIFSNAAKTYLDLIQAPDVSVERKARLFIDYAGHFTMPVSRQKMLSALLSSPDHERITQHVRSLTGSHDLGPGASGFIYAFMPEYLRAVASGQTRASLCYAFPKENGAGQIPLRVFKGKTRKHIIIAALPGAELNAQFIGACKAAEKITIVGPIESEIREFKNDLAEAPNIQICVPARTYLPPYSKANIEATRKADLFAKRLIDEVRHTASLSRMISEDISEDIALALSDRFYRYFQLMLGFDLAFQDLAKDGTVFLLPSPSSAYEGLKALLLNQSESDVVLWDFPGADSSNPAQYTPERKAGHFRDLWKTISPIRRKIRYALQSKFSEGLESHKDHIVIAASHGNVKYRRPVAAICEALEQDYFVSRMTSYPPKGKLETSKAGLSKNLHLALTPKRSPYWMGFRPQIQTWVNRACQNQTLNHINLELFSASLTDILIGRIDAVLALISTGKVTKHIAKTRKRKLLLGLVPGRDPALRIIARKLLKAGHAVLDIQILFVSALGRYAAPVTPNCAVIDKYAKAHYVSSYKIPSSGVIEIGSISSDEDITRGLRLGRKAAREKLFGQDMSDAPVLLFAAQPLPAQDLENTISQFGIYLSKAQSARLIFKLHPSHDESLKAHLMQELAKVIGHENVEQRTLFLQDEVPFYSLLPAADLLLTYFSNVGLMAPAFNIPLLSLPCSVKLPVDNLISIGLAEPVETWDSVPDAIKTALENGPSAKDSRYIKENPHMAEPQALNRLAKIVRELLNEQAS